MPPSQAVVYQAQCQRLADTVGATLAYQDGQAAGRNVSVLKLGRSQLRRSSLKPRPPPDPRRRYLPRQLRRATSRPTPVRSSRAVPAIDRPRGRAAPTARPTCAVRLAAACARTLPAPASCQQNEHVHEALPPVRGFASRLRVRIQRARDRRHRIHEARLSS